MVACLVAAAAITIAACGSSKKSSTSSSGAAATGSNVIDVYSDLPLKGAVNAQTIPTLNGEKLALSQAGNKAGQFTVNFISLDDSTTTSPTNYDLNLCQADARKAATDPKAVYWVGPFNSGCAKVEIPILGVVLILSSDQLSNVSGFVNAYQFGSQTVFGSVSDP